MQNATDPNHTPHLKINNGRYYQGDTALSDFTMSLVSVSMEGDQIKRLVKFSRGRDVVELPAKSMASTTAFRHFCFSYGNYHWSGGERGLALMFQDMDAAYRTRVESQNAMFPPDLIKQATAPAWKDCPTGTIAYSHTGSKWTKQDDGRWRANSGDAFPTPGGDACLVRLPNITSARNGAHCNQYGSISLRVVSMDTSQEGWPMKTVDHGISIEEAHCIAIELLNAIQLASQIKTGRTEPAASAEFIARNLRTCEKHLEAARRERDEPLVMPLNSNRHRHEVSLP